VSKSINLQGNSHSDNSLTTSVTNASLMSANVQQSEQNFQNSNTNLKRSDSANLVDISSNSNINSCNLNNNGVNNSDNSNSKMQSTNGSSGIAVVSSPATVQPRLHPKKRKFDLAELEEIDNQNQSQQRPVQQQACNMTISTTNVNVQQQNPPIQTSGSGTTAIMFQPHKLDNSPSNSMNGSPAMDTQQQRAGVVASTSSYNHNINTIITVRRTEQPLTVPQFQNKKIYSPYR
jgi:hypothetical protein